MCVDCVLAGLPGNGRLLVVISESQKSEVDFPLQGVVGALDLRVVQGSTVVSQLTFLDILGLPDNNYIY